MATCQLCNKQQKDGNTEQWTHFLRCKTRDCANHTAHIDCVLDVWGRDIPGLPVCPWCRGPLEPVSEMVGVEPTEPNTLIQPSAVSMAQFEAHAHMCNASEYRFLRTFVVMAMPATILLVVSTFPRLMRLDESPDALTALVTFILGLGLGVGVVAYYCNSLSRCPVVKRGNWHTRPRMNVNPGALPLILIPINGVALFIGCVLAYGINHFGGLRAWIPLVFCVLCMAFWALAEAPYPAQPEFHQQYAIVKEHVHVWYRIAMGKVAEDETKLDGTEDRAALSTPSKFTRQILARDWLAKAKKYLKRRGEMFEIS